MPHPSDPSANRDGGHPIRNESAQTPFPHSPGRGKRGARAGAAFADGERELSVLDGKAWGRRPVKVTIDDPDAVPSGLLLFAAFVVRRLAEDAATIARSGSSAAAIG